MESFGYGGRVLPEVLGLDVQHVPTFAREATDDAPAATFTIEVKNGRFLVNVDVDTFDDRVVDVLLVPAIDLVRGLVEVVGFTEGVPYGVVVDHAFRPDGEIRHIVLADRRMAALCTAFGKDSIDRVVSMVATDQPLARILSDLMMSLSTPHYSPISCGRVAEGVLRLLTKDKGPAAWAEMRTVLRVDEAYLRLLTEHSKQPRHGHRVMVEAAVTSELLTRAWSLLNRYLAYRLGGGQPLDEQSFPVLEG